MAQYPAPSPAAKRLTVAEAAALIGYEPRVIRGAIEREELSWRKAGGRRYIEPQALIVWDESCRMGGVREPQPHKAASMAKVRRKRSASRAERGSGSIAKRSRKRADGSLSVWYEARISLGLDKSGKRIRKTFTGSTEEQVASLIAPFVGEKGSTLNRDAFTTTLDDHVSKWLSRGKAFGVGKKLPWSPETYTGYELHYRLYVRDYLGDFTLARLTKQELLSFFEGMKTRGKSAPTCREVHKVLSSALGAAVDKDILSENPMRRVPKFDHEPEVAWIPTGQELGRLLKTCWTSEKFNWYYPLYRLACVAPMREAELFGLKRSCLDQENRRINVLRQLQRGHDGKLGLKKPKTKPSIRTIAVDDATISILLAHFARLDAMGYTEEKTQGLAFLTKTGRPLLKNNFLDRVHHPLLLAAGLTDPDRAAIKFHSLRHAANSIASEQGFSLKVLQRRLGHADERLTLNLYTFAYRTEERKLADAIGRLLPEPGSERNVQPLRTENIDEA